MAARGPHLKDGADWAEHEDYLVGDEAGLRNLTQACEVAIEKGKCRREDLGDYVGVKCLGVVFIILCHLFNLPTREVNHEQTHIRY